MIKHIAPDWVAPDHRTDNYVLELLVSGVQDVWMVYRHCFVQDFCQAWCGFEHFKEHLTIAGFRVDGDTVVL